MKTVQTPSRCSKFVSSPTLLQNIHLKDARLNELTIGKTQQPAHLPGIETADSEDCKSGVKGKL